MAKLNVILVGKGQMGAVLTKLIDSSDDLQCVGAYDVDNISELGKAAPAADVLIDFSNPQALDAITAYVRRTHAALVVGTTGLSAQEVEKIKELGEVSAVIQSGNYSLGVATLRHLARLAATSLPGWDIEIVETHHNKKADAPSGTAKMLVEAVDPSGASELVYGREGAVGPRSKQEIGIHSVRGGTVAGTHEVHFFGQDEEVVLSHRATSREIFATGALAAARKLVNADPGFYSFDELMFDAH
ncbi:MAG: 4-hydroxy-tetrahydrodipicolinate reductase [Atopobiaceae bacterium]